MMTVVEFSECFPNKFKPVSGEFILQHVRALSEFCKVITIVPLRFVPPKELFSLNPVKTISAITHWIKALLKTKNFSEGNLNVIYYPYISLPRPYFENINKRLFHFTFLRGIKKLLDGYKPSVIYCNWIRPWADICSEISDNYNVPFVIDHHEDLPTLNKLFPEDYKEILKSFKKADRVIVHSTFNKLDLEKEVKDLNEVRIIYLGQNFEIADKFKTFDSSNIKFICVSHLYEPRKNIDILIRALSLIRDRISFRLTVAGDGELKEQYLKLVSTLNLDEMIKFTGEKNSSEVGKYLDDSDVFILPSYPEAFGVVFIEALAKGLPVITCKGNGGGEELAKLGYPAVLCEPENAEDLAENILNLVNDRLRMNEMSVSGKKIVRDHFTWKKNAEQTHAFLSEIVSEH